MGNGRESGSNLRWAGVLLAGLALLAAGGWMLNAGSRSANAIAHADGSPSLIPSARPFSPDAKPQAHALLAKLPLIFEPNLGQAQAGVQFLARGAGYGLFLDSSGATLLLQEPSRSPGSVLTMKLAGSRQNPALAGADLLPGHSSYFLGNDPAKWHTSIPQYGQVRYREVYPGIDLVFYGRQGQLEYDFQVAPGSDPSRAELEFDSATQPVLRDGEIVLNDGAVRLRAPRAYQRYADREQSVDARFVLLANHHVAFQIGAYDRSRELIIDPALEFSSYFGGNGAVTLPSIAVDSVGNIYLAGSTTSAVGFPIGGTVPTQFGPGTNVFVARINPGNPPAVGYMAFLGSSGGSGADVSRGLAVDGGGNAYLVGNTTSVNFPTQPSNAYQTAPETKGTQCASITCNSGFVTVLNSSATLLNYSSYLSGNGNDQVTGLAIDNRGDAFVTGMTTSTDTPTLTDAFPATNLPQPFQNAPRPGSSVQFFVTKVDTAAAGVGSIAYSTYFGGGTPTAATATGGGIAVDSTGNIYFDGTTNFTFTGTSPETDFPILNAYQPCLNQPPTTIITPPITCNNNTSTNTDGFIAKLNPNAPAGTQLLYSTYLGGSGIDTAVSLGIDSGAASLFVTGSTNSPDFIIPTGTAAFQQCINTPMNPVPPATCPNPANTAFTDAYVGRINNPAETGTTTTNVTLTYFSYLGGSGNDNGNAITVDSADDGLVTGATSSIDFPHTPGALQSTLAGTQNAFFARINTATVTGQTVGSYSTYFGGNGSDRGTGIAIDTNLNTYFAGDTTSTAALQTADALQTTLSGTSDAFVVKLGTAADLAITGVLSLGTGQNSVSTGAQVTVKYTVTNNGPDLATNVVVSSPAPAGTTIDSASVGTGSGSCGSSSTSAACTITMLQSGATATVSITLTPNTPGTYTTSATVSAIDNNDPNSSNNNASVTFTATDFVMTVSPSSQTVAAGGILSYTALLAPQPVFGASITLTCSKGMPSQSSCAPNPSTLTLNGTQSVSLNIATTARPLPVVNARPWRGPLYAAWLVIPGMALFGMGRGRRRKQVLAALAMFGVVLALALQPACSSNRTTTPSTGTPAGTYTVTVTATAGSLSHSQNFSLTVQ